MIHPKVLIESKSQLKTPLTILYKKCIAEGTLPSEWKDAHETPIYKKGKKELSNNYRPISLTSIVCKGLEKIIKRHCIAHLKRTITSCQRGFVEGRSCVTQLLDTTDIWSRLLDDNIPIDAIYLDFAKAFDSVPHERLLVKLESYGIRGKILSFIRNFSTGGRQRVVVDGSFSNWTNVESGVPQGSVLGPFLFTIYINDIPETVDSAIRLFADDAKIFTMCNSQQERETLQQDLNSLQEWSNVWQLRFKTKKCKVMHLGRNNPLHNYIMIEKEEVVTLNSTEREKDLGVYIDTELNFRYHVDRIASKANSILGLIKRSFEQIDMSMFKSLFVGLVRPHLEYANVVWAPFYKKDIDAIEKVQRRGTRMLPELRCYNYEDRLRRLDLPSLIYRRFRGDLIQTYKYIHGHYDVEHLMILEGPSRTRGYKHKIHKTRPKKTVRQRFLSLRISNTWNSLPKDIAEATTLNIFKNKLDKHFKHLKFLTSIDCFV